MISVGNLTLGGTGKTPMVEWVAWQFVQQQIKVGIVSRGYGEVAAQTMRPASLPGNCRACRTCKTPIG